MYSHKRLVKQVIGSVAGCLLCLTCFADEPTVKPVKISDTHGKRYCEVLQLEHFFSLAVYNTFGLNDCPEPSWKKLTVEEVKKETGSYFVVLNGPRYFMMDGLTYTRLIESKTKTFGDIPMKRMAQVSMGIMDMIKELLFSGHSNYSAHKVERHTQWFYHEGTRVYELIDPEGKVFVMQSYSTQNAPLTEASLVTLGQKLKLPSGWTFRTGVLKKEAVVTAIHNKAYVVTDEFLNAYQQAEHDPLDD